MIIKEIINEIFIGYIKSPYYKNNVDYFSEVYLNPTPKEIKTINSKFLRFIAVKKGKKVYIFDADKLLHFDVSKKLNISSNEIVLIGTAIKKNNEYVMMDSAEIFYLLSAMKRFKVNIDKYNNKVKKILETDWSFVNKYIKVDEYLKEIKIDFEKIKR